MRDITPSLVIGTPEEAARATFRVVYVTDPYVAKAVIEEGYNSAMVPTESMAREVLWLLGTEEEQIRYLLSPMDPDQIRLPEP